MPTIRRAMSNQAGSSAGASRLTTTAAHSEIRMGVRAPRRSDNRPANGESPDSIAAEARKVAPMISAVTPRWLSRSGARTSTTPKAMPASMVSHMPVPTCRSCTAGHAARRPCGAEPSGLGTMKATAIRAAPATAAAAKAGPVPT